LRHWHRQHIQNGRKAGPLHMQQCFNDHFFYFDKNIHQAKQCTAVTSTKDFVQADNFRNEIWAIEIKRTFYTCVIKKASMNWKRCARRFKKQWRLKKFEFQRIDLNLKIKILTTCTDWKMKIWGNLLKMAQKGVKLNMVSIALNWLRPTWNTILKKSLSLNLKKTIGCIYIKDFDLQLFFSVKVNLCSCLRL
jgi:hypothetical protein